MTALVLDPHGDDAVLFASVILGSHPHVVVTHPTVPRAEVISALAVFHCTVEFLDIDDPEDIGSYLYRTHHPLDVFAPAFHDEGHEDHNVVAKIARAIYPQRTQSYLTYAPRGQRSREGIEVIPEPWMIAAKLRSLACYQSQIENPATRPWFYDLLDMREWVA